MSDNQIQATPIPAVTLTDNTANATTQSAQPPAASQAPAKSETPAEEKPSWLDARLERERRSLLKELGIDSLDEAKKVLTDAQLKKEAEKSDAQKRGELEKTLESERKRLNEMAEALNAHAAAQLKGLNDQQREAVLGIAGDDPAKQLKTIEALRPTWAGAAAPAAKVEAKEPVRDTAAARSAPKDEGSNASPPDHKAIYAELMKSNPILASRYALEHGVFK
jgi:hypothetical protein